MIMLIQQVEKKENSSSKRCEMRRWSLCNAILMIDWKYCSLPHCTLLVLKFWMTHKQMMDCILSRTFLTKELIYNLTLEIYGSLPMCMCVLLLVLLFVKYIVFWDNAIQWIFSKNIIMYMFNVLIRNNEQWASHFIFQYFFEEIE